MNTRHATFAAAITVALLVPWTGATAQGAPAQGTAELDAFWAEMARTVQEGDFEGYAALYHEDAVLVSLSSGESYPIATALAGWEPGFVDTREGRASASVRFRFSQRLHDGATAHETGIFNYRFEPETGAGADIYIHFEALLVKKDGWKMVMEYQRTEATPAEWEAMR